MQYKQPQNGGYKPAFKSPGVLWSAADVNALWTGGAITASALGNSSIGTQGKQLVPSSNTLYNTYTVSLPATSDYTLAWYGDTTGVASGNYVFSFGLVGTNLSLMLHDNVSPYGWGVWNGSFLANTDVVPSGLHLYVATKKNGVISFYRDGVLKGTVSDATATAAVTGVAINSYSAGTSGSYGVVSPAYHLYAFYETRGWSAGEVLALSRNPWSIFKPVNKVLKASSGGTSYTITGVQATSGVGSLTPSISFALSGVSATSSVGIATPRDSGSISGVLTTSSAQALTPSVALTLAGVQATSSAGNLTPSLSYSGAGVSATGTPGSLSDVLSVALSGVVGTGSAGTVTVSASGSASYAVTGVQATSQAGSLAPRVSVGFGGVVATGYAGALSAQVQSAALGVVGIAAAGSVSVRQSSTFALLGVQASGLVGVLSMLNAPPGGSNPYWRIAPRGIIWRTPSRPNYVHVAARSTTWRFH